MDKTRTILEDHLHHIPLCFHLRGLGMCRGGLGLRTALGPIQGQVRPCTTVSASDDRRYGTHHALKRRTAYCRKRLGWSLFSVLKRERSSIGSEWFHGSMCYTDVCGPATTTPRRQGRCMRFAKDKISVIAIAARELG